MYSRMSALSSATRTCGRPVAGAASCPPSWALVESQGWYRVPVKHAPPGAPDFEWLAFYFTKIFKDDKWAIHYYAPIQGHELVTRRDLIPSEAGHPRAGNWYYALAVAPPILFNYFHLLP